MNLNPGCMAMLAWLGLAPASALGAEPAGLFELQWRKVADKVWVGNREDALRYPVVANTTIVIGEKSVLIFDGGGYAAQGEQTLAKVRALTRKPVTHLVVSHWHGDHHRGTAPILAAFPNADVVAHVFSCAAMRDGPERRVEAGEAQIKDTYAELAAAVAAGKWFDGSALSDAEKLYFSRMAADYPEYEAQLARMKVASPSIAVTEKLTIDLGGREVALMHFGRGNTAGDLVMWLPRERVVAAGDLIVAPAPYGFGSYPKDWAQSLRKIAALDAKTIVPGHGPIMSNAVYAARLAAMLDDVAAQASAIAANEAASRAFDFSAHDAFFGGGDPVQNRLFGMFFKEPIIDAALNIARGKSADNEKLDGPIDDLCRVD